ncbi:prepilin-type N-terminal cleavage/methylation domain-containing protein [Niallia oryzisoli]|uniref:type IV pilus modification PilV family protein n=1 Tax=Niallia oryzisoli TaxID=1737571 RepID=UPI003736B824
MNLHNQKGITLVEVLLSIVILTIVLTSVMNFFPQMGQLNRQNIGKTNAVNVAKEELRRWQKSEDVKLLLAGKADGNTIPEYTSEDTNYYYFVKELESLSMEVKIKKVSDLDTEPTKAHYIHIRLNNEKNALVSETYGYIIYDTGDY